MDFCFKDNVMTFVAIGASIFVSAATNAILAYKLWIKKRTIKNIGDIEMTNLHPQENNICQSDIRHNIVLDINEKIPMYNSKTLPDWVQKEYNQKKCVL